MTGSELRARTSHDLIVIGAGPAGSAAAMTAIKSGLRVAIVDKHKFPRDKLCGGGITGRAIGHYRRIFGSSFPDVPLERRDEVEFFAFGSDLGASAAPPLHLGMRYELDHALLRQAIAAGVDDFTGQSGILEPESTTVQIGDHFLSAPIIIAADGVNSPTAKMLFGSAFDRDQIGFALEVEKPGPDPSRAMRIDFGAANWGYGWQFPKKNSVTIGVGGVMARNADMKKSLRSYLSVLNVPDSLPVKGQFLPFGQFRKIPGRGRVLLAGDAAGLVDPITGEGIAHALHSGSLAAQAVIDALEQGRPESALYLYQRSLRPIHSGLKHANRLRHILFRERLRPAFIQSFRNSRSLRQDYLKLLGGETEYGTIMAKMTTRLPKFAWRALRGF